MSNTTPQELLARLHAPHHSAESAAETAIAVYHAVKSQQEEYDHVAAAAKALLQEIMLETGQTTIPTGAGVAKVTAPAVIVTYDAKALDALTSSSPELERVLLPHRKASERAGTLRITSKR